MLLGIQTSPREIIQSLVLLRAHQIVNEKTLTLNKGSTSEEKQKKAEREQGREGGREGDLTVVLKGSAIIEKCFVPR